MPHGLTRRRLVRFVALPVVVVGAIAAMAVAFRDRS